MFKHKELSFFVFFCIVKYLRKTFMVSNSLSACDDVSPIRSAVASYYFRYDFYLVELFANEIPTVNHGFLQCGESPQLRNANNAPISSDIRLTALWENHADARGGCWEKFYDVTGCKKAFLICGLRNDPRYPRYRGVGAIVVDR